MSFRSRKSRSNTATSASGAGATSIDKPAQGGEQLTERPPMPPPPLPPPPATPYTNGDNGSGSPTTPRRSFTFLRRTKSGEPPGGRSKHAPQASNATNTTIGTNRSASAASRTTSAASGNFAKRNISVNSGKLVSHRKQKALAREEELRQQREFANRAPRIPSQVLLNMTPLTSQTNLADPNAVNKYKPPANAGYSLSPPRSAGYSQSAPFQRSPLNMSPNVRTATPNMPAPPIPESGKVPLSPTSAHASFDPYPRAISMTNRGRYSYASSAFSSPGNPRRVRRRNDPTPFNVLVVGAKGCGKTSFIEFLRTSLLTPFRKRPHTPSTQIQHHALPQADPNSPYTSYYLETELEGERVGLTLWDSKGLERHLVDLQLRELSAFVESKFQETFDEEQKVVRTAGVLDTHIHCVVLLLDPGRLDANVASVSQKTDDSLGRSGAYANNKPRIVGGLDEDLDIDVMRILQGKTTVVPIISKADTITTAHMSFLKRVVWDSLKKVKINPLESLNLVGEEDEEDESDESEEDGAVTPTAIKPRRHSFSSVSELGDDRSDIIDNLVNRSVDGESLFNTPPESPSGQQAIYKAPQHDEIRHSAMSVNVDLPHLPLSIISPDRYDVGVVGRRFPWGFADPYNTEHCDFVKLKDSIFSEWRSELRSASREKWYEGWRTSRLKQRGSAKPPTTLAPPGTAMSTNGPAPAPARHESPTTASQPRTYNAPPSSYTGASYSTRPPIDTRQYQQPPRVIASNGQGYASAYGHPQPTGYAQQSSPPQRQYAYAIPQPPAQQHFSPAEIGVAVPAGNPAPQYAGHSSQQTYSGIAY